MSNVTRRSGGRTARQALRSSKLSDEIRPIRPGMEGGTYKPLSDSDVIRIHHSALDALEQIGLADAPPSVGEPGKRLPSISTNVRLEPAPRKLIVA